MRPTAATGATTGTVSTRVSQKIAIVTGASQGIGAGLAAALRRAGYAVVGTSRSIRSYDDPDFVTVQGDIGEVDTAQRVVEQALDRFGRIDSLINNAGIFIGKPFTDYTLDDYAAVTAVNLAGFFHITQLAIRQMVTQGSGHIVNITTSLVDHAKSYTPSALTSLTKGGLAAVTRSLATEYASRGVRVNAVALGVIKTPTTTRCPTRAWPACTPSAGWARSATWSRGSREEMSTAGPTRSSSPSTAARGAAANHTVAGGACANGSSGQLRDEDGSQRPHRGIERRMLGVHGDLAVSRG